MSKRKIAIFAAGCFWGVQAYFDQVEGVLRTTVGYTGGKLLNPTYEQVCTEMTGHAEATRIEFDPDKITYEKLLDEFFYMHDPTTLNRQVQMSGIAIDQQYSILMMSRNELLRL